MKGYKGMDSNMQCRGMQYEVGKSYHVDGDISVCHNGLHFCEQLTNVFNYYVADGNRFFEIEASGTVRTRGAKSAASDLFIIKELTRIDINRIVYGNGHHNVYGNGHHNGYINGYGDGYGDGCGYGYGDGLGRGNGYGNGYSYGYGNDYGDGYGNGDGNGNGYGDGCGYSYSCNYGSGDGNGNGYGNGNIHKILMFV